MSPCRTQRLNGPPVSGTSDLMTCLCIVNSFRLFLSGLAIPARGWRLNDDRFACVDHGGVGALEPLHAAVLAADVVLADLAVLAAGHAERRNAAVARQHGVFHLLEEPHGAADAVAGMPLAL